MRGIAVANSTTKNKISKQIISEDRSEIEVEIVRHNNIHAVIIFCVSSEFAVSRSRGCLESYM